MENNAHHAQIEYDSDNEFFDGKVYEIVDSLNFHGEPVSEREGQPVIDSGGVISPYHQKSIKPQSETRQTPKQRAVSTFQHPLQNRVSRVRIFLPLPQKCRFFGEIQGICSFLP